MIVVTIVVVVMTPFDHEYIAVVMVKPVEKPGVIAVIPVFLDDHLVVRASRRVGDRRQSKHDSGRLKARTS